MKETRVVLNQTFESRIKVASLGESNGMSNIKLYKKKLGKDTQEQISLLIYTCTVSLLHCKFVFICST